MFQSIIVFVKNPVEGNVKTRVAATVGHSKAVEVYLELLHHTKNIVAEMLTTNLSVRVNIYYGDFVNEADLWSDLNVKKHLQTGTDLGERMKNAFADQFAAGAARVVIVGSDCLALNITHLRTAFEALENNEAVIGPALDGGYYLLGMSELKHVLFENKPWSEPSLRQQTEAELKAHHISYQLIEPLSDIDTWEDYVLAKQQKA
jgi:uncharacterized protein